MHTKVGKTVLLKCKSAKSVRCVSRCNYVVVQTRLEIKTLKFDEILIV